MKKNIIIILSILLCSLNAGSADVYFPGNNIPTKPLTDVRGGDLYVAVVVPDAKFKFRPSKKSENLPNPPGFMDTLMAYEKTSDKRFYLLKKRSGEWGWMQADDILDSSVCLRSENTKNPAFLKVLPKNNWRVNKALGKDVSFFEGPGEHYSKNGKISIFNIRYAFKRVKGLDNKEYIFFGDKPTWEHESPSESLRGWIKRDFCILWDNQVAVYYNKDTLKQNKREPVPVFEKQKHLMKHLKNGSINNIIGKEERIFPEITPDTTRFPVIDHQNNLMQIFWINDALNEKSNDVVKKHIIDKKRGNAYRTINKIEKMDILFLIDSTRSMKQYFKPVADGIAYYIKGLEPNERSRVRFAFGVYRDHDDYPQDFELLHTFNENNIGRKIQNASHQTFSKNKQYYEAVFSGIYKAVQSVFPDYDKNSSQKTGGLTRAVVVIGDHGDRDRKDVTHTKNNISKLLKDRGVAFYAINVGGIEGQSMHYNILFQNQMQSILDLIGQNGHTKIIKQTNEDALTEIRNQIIIYLRETLDFSNQVANSVRQMLEGKPVSEIRKEKGLRVTNYMLDILRKDGWTENDIRLADFSQLCLEGWVSKKDKHNVVQLKPFCLIRRFRLDALVGLLGVIIDGTQSKSRSIEKVIYSACEQATGDPMLEKENLGEYIERVFHIPFRELSKTLRKTPKDIQNEFLINKTFRDDFLKNIKKAYKLLHFVQERKIADINWDRSKKKWLNKTEPIEKEWFFFTSSGVEYCWLPFEYLP